MSIPLIATRLVCATGPVSESFIAHPAELARISERADVLVTGVCSSELVGLAAPASSVEIYAAAGRRRAIVDKHALIPGDGSVHVRWVPDGVWQVLAAGGAVPKAAVLLDLLDCDDPRARREAARVLAS